MSNIAIILAGGVGSRVGADIPKQFINILGKPIVSYTIERFQNNNNIDSIEIVCHKDYIKYMKELVINSNFSKVKWITPGGFDFQHSVINGINNLDGVISDDDIVLTHYAASPFVTDDIIDDAIEVCKKNGNATPAVTCNLLTGSYEDGVSKNWLDRDRIALLNAPHTFKFSYIKDIYKRAAEKGILEKTEPHTTSLMYELGDVVYLSKGSTTNIKITTKDDLEMFEGYVLMRQRKQKMK